MKPSKTFASALTLCAILLIAPGCGNHEKGGSANKVEVKCDNSNEGYKKGYASGLESSWDSPEEHKSNCNNGAGMIGDVPECWNEGFRDGKKSPNAKKSLKEIIGE